MICVDIRKKIRYNQTTVSELTIQSHPIQVESWAIGSRSGRCNQGCGVLADRPVR